MPETSKPEKILRIAVAMRGGVSMAVWIGGVVVELDLLRRAVAGAENCQCVFCEDGEPAECAATDPRTRRAHLYRRLFSQSSYTRIEFDILAGASAGGLNAVFFALAQTYGVAIDDTLHTLWIDVGDLWKLIREPGFGSVPSLLKGDSGLLANIEKATAAIVDKARTSAHPDAVAERVAVELAATMLTDPQVPDLGNRASFSFVRGPGGLASRYSTVPGILLEKSDGAKKPVYDDGADMVPGGTVPVVRARMSLAARASSSFPGAFEPAAIHSVDCDRQVAPCTALAAGPRWKPDEAPALSAVNMASAFPFARSGKQGDARLGRDCDEFRVIDGGVFDNIPIDRALRAISRAPAGNKTERRLVYLDPEPPAMIRPRLLPVDVKIEAGGPVASSDRAASRRRLSRLAQQGGWSQVIAASIGLKMREETAADEIAAIREHNECSLEVAGRLEGLAGLLPGNGVIPEVDITRYIEARKAVDIERLGSLAAAPGMEMNIRPHSARPYHGVSAVQALSVKNAVDAVYEMIVRTPDPQPDVSSEQCACWVFRCGDVGAALDTAQILISWTQQLQRLTPTAVDSVMPLGTIKSGLYRCLTVLVEARRKTVDTAMVEQVRRRKTRIERVVDGLARQRRLQMHSATDLLCPGSGVDDAAFYTTLWPVSKDDALSLIPKDDTPPETSFLSLIRTILDVPALSAARGRQYTDARRCHPTRLGGVDIRQTDARRPSRRGRRVRQLQAGPVALRHRCPGDRVVDRVSRDHRRHPPRGVQRRFQVCCAAPQSNSWPVAELDQWIHLTDGRRGAIGQGCAYRDPARTLGSQIGRHTVGAVRRIP
ncbi:patatin-like phospholipase family protein [Gordonia sp. NPDC003424]